MPAADVPRRVDINATGAKVVVVGDNNCVHIEVPAPVEAEASDSLRSLHSLSMDLSRQVHRRLVTAKAELELTLTRTLPIRWRRLGGDPQSTAANNDLLSIAGPARRLVVLGQAGAGKSVFAIQLGLSMLSQSERVPIIVPLHSWDPFRQAFQDWIVGTIITDRLLGSTARPCAPQAAHDLLHAGWLLPILDGLDEMPAPMRAEAIRVLNAYDEQPLVLTTRPTAYLEAGHLENCTHAELQDLTIDDLRAFLPADPWEEIFREADAGNLMAKNLVLAVSTPLMAMLASRTHSGKSTSHPRNLLDPILFPDPASVREHLLEIFPRTVAQRPLTPRDLNSRHRRWSVAQTERWLQFLARHQSGLGDRKLRWWQLRLAAPAIWMAQFVYIVGVLAGLVAIQATNQFLKPVPWVWCIIGSCAAVPTLLRWNSRSDRQAAIVIGPNAPSSRRWRRKAVHGSIDLAVLVILSCSTVVSRETMWITIGPLLMLKLISLIRLLARLLHTRLARSNSPLSPLSHLRQSRTAALGESAAGVLAIVLASWLAVSLLSHDDPHILFDLSRWTDDDEFIWPYGPSPSSPWLFLVTPVFIGLVAAPLVVSQTVWGSWLFCKVWLAAGRRAPLRIVAFLGDAHASGILRISDDAYEFRHTLLIESLTKGAAHGSHIWLPWTRSTLAMSRQHERALMNLRDGNLNIGQSQLESVLTARTRVLGPNHPSTLIAAIDFLHAERLLGRSNSAMENLNKIADLADRLARQDPRVYQEIALLARRGARTAAHFGCASTALPQRALPSSIEGLPSETDGPLAVYPMPRLSRDQLVPKPKRELLSRNTATIAIAAVVGLLVLAFFLETRP